MRTLLEALWLTFVKLCPPIAMDQAVNAAWQKAAEEIGRVEQAWQTDMEALRRLYRIKAPAQESEGNDATL